MPLCIAANNSLHNISNYTCMKYSEHRSMFAGRANSLIYNLFSEKRNWSSYRESYVLTVVEFSYVSSSRRSRILTISSTVHLSLVERNSSEYTVYIRRSQGLDDWQASNFQVILEKISKSVSRLQEMSRIPVHQKDIYTNVIKYHEI